MVFIRFQYPLQRHFVVLVVAGLVVDITIMQAPIAIHRFMFIPMVLQDLSVGLLQVPNKQWGENVGGGGQTVSLPISFEVAFTAVVSADSSWCNASCHITTTTITTMNYQSNKPDIAQLGPVQWLAIGIQPQWGFEETETKTIAFPISFESIKYVFLSKIYGPASGGADTVAYNFFRKSLTGVSFDYAYTRNWLAIGGQ